MSLRHHEIAEAGHRILNPFTEAKLRLLGEVCRLRPGTTATSTSPAARARCCADGPTVTASAGIGRGHQRGVPGRRRTNAPRELGVSDRSRSSHGDARRGPSAPTPLRRGVLHRRRPGSAAGSPAPSSCCVPAAAPRRAAAASASRTGSDRRRPEAHEARASPLTTSPGSSAPSTGSRRLALRLVEMVLADRGQLGPVRGGAVVDRLTTGCATNQDDPDAATMRRLSGRNQPRAPARTSDASWAGACS